MMVGAGGSETLSSDEKLYGDRADLYDLIYTKIDYAANADRLAELLAAEGVADGAHVLEAACGTGSYVAALRDRYRMTGLDNAEAMLAISRRKNPGVPHVLADMADFRPEDLPGGERFDAVLCLFSSFGYLHGEERVRAALRSFAGVLRPGGVAVVEPWIPRERFVVGHSHLQTCEDDAVKVARASYSTVRATAGGEAAVVDFEWVISRTGIGLDRFTERHELWFCPPGVMETAFREAGMAPRFLEDGLLPGRGLWVARRDGGAAA